MVQDESSDGRTSFDRARRALRFRVLGPLEVLRPTGEVVGIRRAKPARLLAVLLIHVGRPVTVDALVDAVWPDAPPATAVKTLQTYVGQVRSVMEPDREPGDTGTALRTEATAYRLAVPVTAVDAERFGRLVRRASDRLPTEPTTAAALFDQALELWRGTPYSDFGSESFARPEIHRLEELRMTALEGRIDARLALGHAADVVPQLQDLVRRHALREHLWVQLMRALYLTGRQADALGAYTSARNTLATELGVDPGPELQRVHAQVLAQDVPGGDGPADAAVRPPPRERRPTPEQTPPQRRSVTVLCIDGAEPDDRTGRDGLAATIERYGGAVARTGNGVVAVFGAPRAQGDDPERAVRCAFALRRWAGATGARLRMGIDSGEAEVAVDAAAQVTVRGRPPDGASALARRAAPDELLVDERTMHSSRHAVRYRAHGTIGVWRAVGVVEGPPGRRPSATPFVGRQTELELLDGLWTLTLRARRPQVVTVVGPAGVGKSRLLGEFVGRLTEQGVRVLTGRSYPFGDAIFGPIAQVVSQLLGLPEALSGRTRRSRIDEWLTAFLPPDERDRQPEHLVTLLSVLGDVAEHRDRTIESLRRLVELAAARQPTAVVLDDLHHARPELVNLVASVSERARGVPLLFIVATRPQALDARPSIGAGPHGATTLPLDELPPADAQALARALSSERQGARPPAAGGNPLFIEELVRWHAAGDPGHGPVPPTVRSVVLARLDALPTPERQALVDASVVGHRFWSGAVHALAAGPGDAVEAALDALEHRHLIVRRPDSRIPGQPAFSFRHELFADVAYATVPQRLRADKHHAVAEWLGQVGEAAPPALLAHHWRSAGDPERAADQLVAAADDANRGWSRDRAVSLYQQAVDVVADRDPERARRINLRRAVALQAWAHVVLDVGHIRRDAHDWTAPPPDAVTAVRADRRRGRP